MIIETFEKHSQELVYVVMPLITYGYFYGVIRGVKSFAIHATMHEKNILMPFYYYVVALVISIVASGLIPMYIGNTSLLHEIKVFLLLFIPGVIGLQKASHHLYIIEKERQERQIKLENERI